MPLGLTAPMAFPVSDLTPADALRDRLRADLKSAMKTRDAIATGLLRRLIAVIDNAEAVAVPDAESAPISLNGGSPWVATGGAFGGADVARRLLTVADLAALLQNESNRCRQTAEEMDRVGRPDEAKSARAELQLISTYTKPTR